jgi:hypothetical protein
MNIELTDEEVVKFLAGCARPEVVSAVQVAKLRILVQEQWSLSWDEADFLVHAYIRGAAGENLSVRPIRLHTCRTCGRTGGYRPYVMDSPSGHLRGEPDIKRPIYLNGIDLLDTTDVIVESAFLGCCVECWTKLKSYLNILKVEGLPS